MEISKADSHISNPEEIEKKLKHDSISEESKKYSFYKFVLNLILLAFISLKSINWSSKVQYKELKLIWIDFQTKQ